MERLPAISTVIFDLGNVLVFHDNAYLFRRLGGPAGLEGEEVERRLAERGLFEAVNRGRLDAAGIHREVCRALALDVDMDEFAALWSCHFTVNEPILPLVEQLVGRVTLVLLSNTNALHTACLRPRLPVLERFDHLLFSNEVGLVKPERQFFETALTRAGAEPEQTAFFDDFPEFVDAARALGIHGYVFRNTGEFAGHLRALGLPIGAPPTA
jgi:glucose-1-phosphatase